MNYELRLILTKFIDSKIIEVENADGMTEEGVFIPIERNCLYRKDNGAIEFAAFVTENIHSPNDRRSHYVKLKIPKEDVFKLKELGYEPPYLGSMRITHPTFEKRDKFYNNSYRVKKIED